MRWFSIVSVAALFYACGGDDRPSQVTPVNTGGHSGSSGSGGRSSTGGSGGGSGGAAGAAGHDAGAAGSDAGAGGVGGTNTNPGGAGGEGGESAIDPRAPIVEITSPQAVSDPDDGEVLLADNVTVLCRVAKSTASGSVAIDASTIKIAMLDASGKPLEKSGTSTGTAGEYSATFVLTEYPNGVVSFRCTARDSAAQPRVGSAQISTFVDHGPTIAVTKPQVDQVLPSKVPAAFEFTVEPAPLADGDAGAAVDQVTLSVRDIPIQTLAPAPNRPGVYIATVDFTDPALFPEVPTGDIGTLITARNKRSPKAAVRSEAYTFELDGEGPVIKITDPKPNDIIGPKKRILRFSVTDVPAGVDKETVTVSLNGEEFHYQPGPPWTENNGSYTFTFVDTQIEGSVAQATINVHATDKIGNEADGASLVVYLDDYPPIVSLDPPPVRIQVKAASATAKPTCSSSFDPLGSAVNDLATIADSATFRVFVWDETNHAVGQTVDYLSGANRSSVFVYLQPDPADPLLIDSDGDGRCDQVKTTDADDKDLRFLRLAPVPPQGGLPKEPNDFGVAPAVSADSCLLSTAGSGSLCSSDMAYVLKHEIVGVVEPVVYARDPAPGNALGCTGGSWEVRGLAKHSGWVCMAAVASDVAENAGLSRPLRVCIDDDNDTSTSPCSGVEPPTCTDGCQLPATFPSRVIRY